MSVSKWIKRNTSSLVGKTVAVTGSTGGIGVELCRHLAALGASLVLVDRNIDKSMRHAESLRAEYPDIQINHITADMESVSDVAKAADKLAQLDIDYLILNAGAYSIPRRVCETGYCNVFQINFVSPFYLANRLLPSIREKGGRVVAVSSIAHRYSQSDALDVDFSKCNRASLVYGNAKRYLTYSLFDLAACGGGISVVHPGITFTNITSHYPKMIFAIIKYPMKVIFMKPKKAALCVLGGLFSEVGEDAWLGPRLFGIWGYPKRRALASAEKDEAERMCNAAKRIMEEMEKIVAAKK